MYYEQLLFFTMSFHIVIKQWWMYILYFMRNTCEINIPVNFKKYIIPAGSEHAMIFNLWVEDDVFRLFQDTPWVNTMRPPQNVRHFADDIFKCTFMIETSEFLIKITEICSLMFNWQYDNISTHIDLAPIRRQTIIDEYIRHSEKWISQAEYTKIDWS